MCHIIFTNIKCWVHCERLIFSWVAAKTLEVFNLPVGRHYAQGFGCNPRIKAVVLNEACFLPSPSNRNHGSSSFIGSAVFCALCCFAYREKSFTCCRPLGSSPELEHFEIPPSSSATVVYNTLRGVILLGAFFSRNFVLSHVRTQG